MILSKKIKIIFIIVIGIAVLGWGYSVYDVNHRLPNPTHVTYNRDTPAYINGLKIIPIQNRIYTMQEFKDNYPSYTYFNEISQIGNERIVVFELEASNTSSDNMLFSAISMEAFEIESCWSNGCNVIEENMNSPIIKPGETITLHLVAFIFGGSMAYEKIKSLNSNQFGLALSYYPQTITLRFEK